jgi:predicted AAA+ superfamily ATPase
MSLIARFFSPPEEDSYFLFGPRGTGKSTWLRQRYPDALWINLLDLEEFRFYSPFPERLIETIEGKGRVEVVIIDEIQKIPEMLSTIHLLIEKKLGIQFILTGSSARKLKRLGADLLAGRALLCKMYPFIAGELQDQFSLKQSLQIGLLPLVLKAKSPESTLKTYAAMYLVEEIQNEGLVRQVGNFARFMEIASLSHASLLNTTNIARECSVSRKTVESYLQILEDLLLAFSLRVFTKRAQRTLSAHQKFYFFDAGIFRSLRPLGPIDSVEESEGAALEGLVAHHLRYWIEAQKNSWSLSFWRTRSGVEVDFIIYGETGFFAIEVKNNTQAFKGDLRGLKEFCKDYPECTPLLLYRGSKRVVIDGILCIPCEEFLLQVNPNKPLFMMEN